MQLILFHHAGGDKYAFQYLSQKLNQDFEIIYYELPGRNYRLNESLLFDIHQIVDDAYNTILPYTQNDFVFIGMSMGALISFLV
ncbi:MAG TPA: thioesterase domain-containing protein, partial [Chitinophagales bacterium]|nr:thioesterase domain-containing protein [Chitinophagales bacterium]